MSRLQKDLKKTRRKAFAAGSVRNLKSQWKKFSEFCGFMKVVPLPISVEKLCLYIQFLSRSLCSPQSIHNYVSGLRCFHKLLDIPFPSTQDLSVRLTFKGLEKTLKHVPKQASPITPVLLSQLYDILNHQDVTHVVFYCLFLFLFFLFARKFQFVVTPGDDSKLVRRGHVVAVGRDMLVKFVSTKTRLAGGKP